MPAWERIKSFLPYRMKRQVRELLVSTTLVNLALAMVMIFEPIYLYQIGYDLRSIMIFYLITYIIYFLILPLGAKFAKSYGYERGIFLGTALFIIYYISLFFITRYGELFYVAPVILALQKMFYWPAYHADFAKFSEDTEEGREISSLSIINSLVFILGPALAGFILAQWGYGALFTVASILFLVSNIPTLVTRESFIPQPFAYTHTYRHLFDRANRQYFLAYLGFGEEFVLLVVWPVFISLIISDFLDLGLIVALSTLLTTIVVFYVGKLSDFRNKKSLISLGSMFYSLAWFIRLFVVNTLGVFFVDSLSRLSRETLMVPMVSLTYEKAKEAKDDQHHHLMSTIIFFEMSLVIGKILAMLFIFLLASFLFSEILVFKLSFILAGAMALLYLLL